ncbi:GNAT family N-acetyltransferase [Pseudactinotalea sp. Z1732]|uniref:GNAT family N-acetyltransferase n=1 Tax=Pseudactinotalea sp. Z1732 TaxID=3413026 RepID=UPI003C7AD6F3
MTGVAPEELVLRPPGPRDEAQVRRAASEVDSERFTFLSGADRPWDEILRALDSERRGVNLAPGRVRADYLLAVVGPDVVGRTSIRYELNDFLLQVGGHVGYAVRPAFRRRGYATRILELSLAELRRAGVQRALVTCDDDNAASAAIITRRGGVLEDMRRESPGVVPKRRYWIDLG